MKILIRKCVFETNSSSVHTLSVCREEEYKKYMNWELFFTEDGELVDKSYVINVIKDRNPPPYESYQYEDVIISFINGESVGEERENEFVKEYKGTWNKRNLEDCVRMYLDILGITAFARDTEDTPDVGMEEYVSTRKLSDGSKVVCFGKYGRDD